MKTHGQEEQATGKKRGEDGGERNVTGVRMREGQRR